MKKEEKLLLQDLTSRLSFGVMCEYKNETCSTTKPLLLTDIRRVKIRTGFIYWDCYFEDNGERNIPVEIVRPYLRPLSSMTDEESYNLCESIGFNILYTTDEHKLQLLDGATIKDNALAIIWLIKHHFDYLGLIDLGMAIEVTKENNPYEKA